MLREFTVDMISEGQNDLADFMIGETMAAYIDRMYQSGQWTDNIINSKFVKFIISIKHNHIQK